ncbi:Serine carboxypeptidase [Phytophthora infestans]|uniref:Serine carboxypeptidase n=1 Tax=Phytophthora infestans TaxID=4787 RepID=A0A833WM34_PHYIN|nr:Serine carboxypeptidase [Phytophthora infestans]
MLRHLRPDAVHINLAGIAVGNGLTDPAVQYLHSVDMAFNSYNVSLLNEQAVEDMRKAQPVCHELIIQCQKDRPRCVDAMEFCSEALEGPYYQSGRNPYDIREPCTEENVMKCFHFEHIDQEDKADPPSFTPTFLNPKRLTLPQMWEIYEGDNEDRMEGMETCRYAVIACF